MLFQIRDEYSFVLTLTDGHLGEGNYITQSFLLLVEDVNDNEPIFKPYPSAITVKEDASPGILTTVEATDLDEGAYGQVRILFKLIVILYFYNLSQKLLLLLFQTGCLWKNAFKLSTQRDVTVISRFLNVCLLSTWY